MFCLRSVGLLCYRVSLTIIICNRCDGSVLLVILKCSQVIWNTKLRLSHLINYLWWLFQIPLFFRSYQRWQSSLYNFLWFYIILICNLPWMVFDNISFIPLLLNSKFMWNMKVFIISIDSQARVVVYYFFMILRKLR